ncbi:ATP synthase F1 subunit epsilon [[Pseudomonas] boreopolis]|uniref:ATP synthase F1 subunit epsilon n=1 Tax=Xanthomonas boreopolis TaxID=86183 RepID=UPI003DA0C1B6
MSSQPATISLDVVSLTGSLWSGQVREVSLPGREGRFGVMARHVPMLVLLREGMLHLQPLQGEPEDIYISGGYVEVQPDRVLVVADLAERNEDLDAARAQAARDRAASLMARNFTDEIYAQLHMELLHRYSANLRYPTRR